MSCLVVVCPRTPSLLLNSMRPQRISVQREAIREMSGTEMAGMRPSRDAARSPSSTRRDQHCPREAGTHTWGILLTRTCWVRREWADPDLLGATPLNHAGRSGCRRCFPCDKRDPIGASGTRCGAPSGLVPPQLREQLTRSRKLGPEPLLSKGDAPPSLDSPSNEGPRIARLVELQIPRCGDGIDAAGAALIRCGVLGYSGIEEAGDAVPKADGTQRFRPRPALPTPGPCADHSWPSPSAQVLYPTSGAIASGTLIPALNPDREAVPVGDPAPGTRTLPAD